MTTPTITNVPAITVAVVPTIFVVPTPTSGMATPTPARPTPSADDGISCMALTQATLNYSSQDLNTPETRGIYAEYYCGMVTNCIFSRDFNPNHPAVFCLWPRDPNAPPSSYPTPIPNTYPQPDYRSPYPQPYRTIGNYCTYCVDCVTAICSGGTLNAEGRA